MQIHCLVLSKPEVPKTLADAHPQGRVQAPMADQEPVWPSLYLHFKQEILALYSERYCFGKRWEKLFLTADSWTAQGHLFLLQRP